MHNTELYAIFGNTPLNSIREAFIKAVLCLFYYSVALFTLQHFPINLTIARLWLFSLLTFSCAFPFLDFGKPYFKPFLFLQSRLLILCNKPAVSVFIQQILYLD
ncbi:hypothetical protein PGIN_ATCC49417_01152 [Porphyromonas gingivalis]|nr:hypothetical protein PGIN_ATCC49417_01152 [Porphyromonas gingivalis]